jgi:MFS family permease
MVVQEKVGLKASVTAWFDRDKFWILTSFLLLVVLRLLPALHRFLYNMDEGITLSVGAIIAKGGLVYVDGICQRGPLLHFTAAAVHFLAGGFNIVAWNLTGFAFVAATTWLIRVLGRDLYGRRAANLGMFLFVLVGSLGLLIFDAQGLNGEQFGNVPAVAAMIVLVRSYKRKSFAGYFFAGLLVMVGALFKQVIAAQSALIALAALITVFSDGSTGKAWRDFVLRGVLATLGFAIPLAVVLAIYGKAGHLKEFWFWFYQYNSVYAAQGWRLLDVHSMLFWFFSVLYGRLLPIGLGALVAAFFVLSELIKAPLKETLPKNDVGVLGFAWTAITLISVLFGFRPFGYYFVQALPALSVFGAYGLVRLLERPTPERSWFGPIPKIIVGIGVIAFAVMAGINGWVWFLHAGQGVVPGVDRGWHKLHPFLKAADRIKEMTKPDDTIFVWGFRPRIYPLAERRPATRYVSALYLSGQYGGLVIYPHETDLREHILPGVWKNWVADINKNRPAVIVDGSTQPFTSFVMLPMGRFPLLESAVALNYDFADVVQDLTIYQRKKEPWKEVAYVPRMEYAGPEIVE